jgi:putative membrane protein
MGDRLHPAGIAVYALSTLRDGLLPLAAIFAISVVGGGGLDSRALVRGAMFAALGTALAGLAGLLRWAATTYRVDETGVHYRRGWLSVKEVDVPAARIQALDTSQGPVQRLFGVVALHVQTGGGGAGGEIVLDAVTPQQVAAIRALLARGRPDAAAAAEEEPRAEARLSRGMLIVAALTAGQLGVILPVLAGVASVLQNTVTDERSGREAFRLLPDTAAEWALAAAALLAAAWLLSVLGAIVAFSGFTVVRHEDRLRIRRGLLQRREVTLPVGRVRAIRVVEGLLRQPLGLASVRVEVIGHAKEPAAAQTLFPLLRVSEVEAFLRDLLPELADALEPLERPPPRARRRYLLAPALEGVVLGGLACLVPGAAPWPLLVIVPAVASGWLAWRAAGWRLDGGRLAVRSRRLARTTVLGPAANRESHAVAQTLLQRRAALADVGVAFGKATTASVRHLDAAVAWRIWEGLR